MNILLSLLLAVLCSAAAGKDKTKSANPHSQSAVKSQPRAGSQPKYVDQRASKKEEMLGQDTVKIDEAEFKLQSMISPEFHQAREVLRQGRPYNGLEMNTLSPEQVAFVQGTAQWPKFFSPQASRSPTKTIYPEDPVLFPNERMPSGNSPSSSPFAGNPLEGMDMGTKGRPDLSAFDDVPMMGGNGNTGALTRTSNTNPNMVFEEKPAYLADGDSLLASPKSTHRNLLSELDQFSLPSSSKGLYSKHKKLLSDPSKILNEDLTVASSSIYGPSKSPSFESFLDGEVESKGKPVGILKNILKASKSMMYPSDSKHKPSPRSWLNDGPFSRRQKLERAKDNITISSKMSSTRASVPKKFTKRKQNKKQS
ncbi:uncharacterized protein LOC5515763 [Nematostella vectensis]|uniref:uncharacterized protein LOC5515763 n=1 Tax=Nematostella vectensis TaxID=45351 RepID=UPI00207799C9|nr:uncharacterized protein LOC5515763 [Nematostella vectensis]